MARSGARRHLSSTPVRSAGGVVRLTSEAYPNIVRDERFAQVTAEDVAFFKDVLGSDSALIDGVTSEAADIADDIAPFNEDWMRKYRGQGRLVLKPQTTEQVSRILAYCNDKKLAVIVLNLSRMNNVISFDEVSGVLVIDAGVILEVADQYLAERGHIFPLDLGAKGSCQVGGNLATNAGGLRLLRYGNLHGTVLGIEAVLPDGTVVDELSTLRKNNTGYDLKQLFIGAEGTIGVITKVAIQCPQRPKAVNVAFFGLESFKHARLAFREAKSQLSEILSAFELMDATSQNIVQHVTGYTRPLDGDYPFYCLVETSGSNGEHDYAKLEAFLEDVMSKEIVLDGVVAQDETQAQTLWKWREGVPEALGHVGGVYKYDVSIPLEEMYQLVEDTKARIQEAGLLNEDLADTASAAEHPVSAVVGYGHMGDSNLHLNVSTRVYDKRVEKILEPFVYEWIQKRKGSISAEHGLGVAKKAFIGYSRSDTMVKLMKQIKDLYDPNGIMNPYKYI
ncbi:unnamed protein product [Parascedosporium putredinis]|uniref:FAD-binding PCMH-type domain-containing protein n=1 Tax=Parascedosporium putredinis TaxID=1442378 RepID=A0A9P1H987_9PEZI|nr:unnamed protein product [Parascedosporium putredinis]CAI8000663.1 unnamed protein product [Parascedosporium putredinis]